jgi:hypothetical protein
MASNQKLILEIYSGEQTGERIIVREGLLFGRKDVEIILKDPKVSGRHAKIEVQDDGSFSIVDLGSANGIKVDGVRVNTLRLAADVTFVLGQTSFRVFDHAEVTQEIRVEEVVPPTWQELVHALAIKTQVAVNMADLENKSGAAHSSGRGAGRNSGASAKAKVAAFPVALRLNFLQGAQLGQTWEPGYGPRPFGSQTRDFVIEEYGCPAVAFELSSVDQKVCFKSSAGDVVTLNQLPAPESAFLKDGDIIGIRNTLIKISLEPLR